MNLIAPTLLGLSGLFGSLFLGLWPASAPQTRGLVRVRDGDAAEVRLQRDETPARDDFDAAQWKRRLQQPSLDEREAAYAELLALAQHDDAAHAALREWAQSGEASELAWTSRLALRELAASGPARRAPRARAFAGPDLSDLERRMEELSRHLGSMDSMFDDLQRSFGGLAPTPHAGGARSHAKSYSLRSSPDGVQLEVKELEDGREQTKTYEAKTLEELYDAHPELRSEVDLQIAPSMPPIPWLGGARGQQPRTIVPLDPHGGHTPFVDPARPLVPDAEPSSERLGVYYDEPAADGSDEPGLRVTGVVRNSYAERLGIRAGDRLVELNGARIEGVEDVKEVLRVRQPGDELRAEVRDAQGRKRSMSYQPSAPKAPAPPEKAPEKSGGSTRF